MPKLTPKSKKIRLLYALCALVVAAALAFQIGLDVKYWHSTQYSTDEPVATLVVNAVKALNKPAVIDPISKKVYLPDANLILPPQPAHMSPLLYSFTPRYGHNVAEADVTLQAAVNRGIAKLRIAEGQGMMKHDPTTVFNAVPNLQVCARGIHIVFGSDPTYEHLLFTKKLSDGKTIHAYTEKSQCGYDLKPLENYLRKVESY